MSRIFVPGVRVRHLIQPIEGMRLGLRGRVVDVQVLERGIIVQRTGPFENLILDQGMNEVANRLWSGLFTHCAVGTGNTPPANNQTGLVAEAARTANYLAGAGNCGTTKPAPNVVVMRRTWDFPLGALNGNYSELGFSWTSTPGNNLFSRVLIQSGGVPVSVSVTSSQQLRVVYELQLTFANTISPFSLNFGGDWGTVTGNMALQSIFPDSYGTLVPVDVSGYVLTFYGNAVHEPSLPSDVRVSNSAAALAAVGSANDRTGTVSMKTAVKQTYTAGSFYRDITATFGTNDANQTIRSIMLGSQSASTQGFAALLDANKTKTNLAQLTLSFRLSWSRG